MYEVIILNGAMVFTSYVNFILFFDRVTSNEWLE